MQASFWLPLRPSAAHELLNVIGPLWGQVGQHLRTLSRDGNIVLYPNTNPPEIGRKVRVLRDVDARLNRHDHARLEHHIPPNGGGVVGIHPEVVPNGVGVEPAIGLRM